MNYTIKDLSYGKTCHLADQCRGYLSCVKGYCGCSDDKYHDHSTQLCIKKRELDENCVDSRQCSGELKCRGRSCLCDRGLYYNTGSRTCSRPVDHGSSCSTNNRGMCKPPLDCLLDVHSARRCLCKDKFHSEHNNCVSYDGFIVSVTKTQTTAANEIGLGWQVLARDDVTYRVDWVATDDQTERGGVAGNNSGATLTGLTPGTRYKVTVYTVLGRQGFYPEKNVSRELTVVTAPAPPGPVNQQTSTLDKPPYRLKFQPSVGRVHNYVFHIQVNKTWLESTVTSPDLELSNLEPDKEYLYRIQAVNFVGQKSGEVSGRFKTARLQAFDERCAETRQCRGNLKCVSGTCSCDPGFYYNPHLYICNTALEHGSACSSTIRDMCKPPMLNCLADVDRTYRCLCKDKFHREDNNCVSSDKLVVGETKPNTEEATQIGLGWQVLARNDVTYRVDWVATDDQTERGGVAGNNSGATLTGLTPGTRYKVTVYTVLGRQGFYPEKNVSRELTVVTAPAPPGPVNQQTSTLDKPPYRLKFQPSVGRVHNYVFHIQVNKTWLESTVTSPDLELSNLEPDKEYLYRIQAVNFVGQKSGEVSGRFKTARLQDRAKTGIIAGTCVGSAVLAVLAILIILKRRQSTNNRDSSFSSSKQDRRVPLVSNTYSKPPRSETSQIGALVSNTYSTTPTLEGGFDEEANQTIYEDTEQSETALDECEYSNTGQQANTALAGEQTHGNCDAAMEPAGEETYGNCKSLATDLSEENIYGNVPSQGND
ncbi:fibronectin-like [Physella acuta]|uniref:fibronectin-like n=1 Tax=Physella acuta TaxID=109671 RepID=UPI0027DABC68|nr:fibronectin-like [Physella acuta]